jgi:hypothetical protein
MSNFLIGIIIGWTLWAILTHWLNEGGGDTR